MSKTNLLVLPNQLFDIKYFKKNNITPSSYNITLYEHPQYFTKYKYNKKKLLLHYASLDYYTKYLKDNGFKVDLIKYNKNLSLKDYDMFRSGDNLSDLKPDKVFDSPNYLLNTELHDKYSKKTDKFMFGSFYTWAKKELDIIPNIKSKDKENRERMPDDVQIPNIKKLDKSDYEFIKNNVKNVENNFKNNYGNTENFIYPVTHKSAKLFLKNFIKYKFINFGPYQDFIKKGESFMFHSVLSSSINIGLINPIDIIETIKKYEDKVPVNSYEGYIRQLFWREYQLYCYNYIDYKSELKKPFFNYKNKLDKSWYDGTTGNELMDDTIKKGFDTAYLHHIERLMVIGNYMNLTEIKPEDGIKWFIEFPIDSYEWVMYQNVYDMVFFVTAKTMRKPYITSDNYLLKMSNYKKGEWSENWKELYYKFLKKHKEKLKKYPRTFPPSILKKL